MKMLSRLIPKNHFCSFFIFREEPFINWEYTNIVLFTAFDFYRSNSFWIDEIMRTGKTLKEGLIDLGFPKNVDLMADTGIFEIEAKKAGFAKKLGIEVEFKLSNEEVFHAYEISGADFFVTPDEIIHPLDTKETVKRKVAAIKENTLQLLEIVPSNQVTGIIQGCKTKTIELLFDFFKSCGIKYLARGGAVPLYKYDNQHFENIMFKTREITNEYWLHTFGLPRVSLLPYYIHTMKFDSVDTSLLLYLSARKQYLVGINPRPVRLVDFLSCDCKGCQLLQELKVKRNNYGKEFFIALYIHNIVEASQISTDKSRKKSQKKTKNNSREEKHKSAFITKKSGESDWITVKQLIEKKHEDKEL
ncbi:MAG: hypothetical protein GF411_00255 [Candidatus Lokiarchaeota archaeon]|nr:hypothetical protein [Candidatus Lokiarchaeota archaeon]